VKPEVEVEVEHPKV